MKDADDMPMPMSEDGKASDEKPDAKPQADEEIVLKIKAPFNDALRVLMGKSTRESPSAR